MKINLIFPILLLGLSIQGTCQVNCKNEQIDLLRLDLAPSFQDFATIEISCNGAGMSLIFKTFKYGGKEINHEQYDIPPDIYKEFKSAILPLGIQSMSSLQNPYLADGLIAEITFMDRYNNFNRFEIHMPIEKKRHHFLVTIIISLTEKLQILETHRYYLKSIRDMYLD